ncbi:hypothetical protein AGOR_G00205920 [Albula goreensis]|uniref:C-type lectin domain-containing protein n=1 Tax=Albula goreensis TaxID=1534307 RepID=A0A8T3CNT3_9TELE|nr:hypothetical protein AGOR_G00205920 [Albula goreensis]
MWLSWSQIVVIFIFPSFPTGFCSLVSSGTEFVTAFMENIAYFYWTEPTHKLLIACLRDNTVVNVTVADQAFKKSLVMSEGQAQEVVLPSWVELEKFNSSYKTVHVSSNSPVTVFSINQKGSSIDTSVVLPIQNLGTQYRVAAPTPPVDRLYQFVVINTNEVNTVTVSHSSKEKLTVTLGPYENAQFQAAQYPVSTEVTAQTPVAVLFGHPCSELDMCKCSIAFEQLSPVPNWGTQFIVPDLFLTTTMNQSLVVVTSDGSDPKDILPSKYHSEFPPSGSYPPVLEDSSTHVPASVTVAVSLLQPGLMTLIPEESFATCYLLHTLGGYQNYALVVVMTKDKEGVMLGEETITKVTWKAVDETDYSVGLVELDFSTRPRVIWHLTSKMGVYIFGKNYEAAFGSPALILKVEPDGSKCRAYPGQLELVLEEKSWTDAVEHCWNTQSELGSFNSDKVLGFVARELGGTTLSSAWVGLRKSLLSGEWRWLTREPMAVDKWSGNQPNTSLLTQCAEMSLEPKTILAWSATSCCDQLPFICFKQGTEMPFP